MSIRELRRRMSALEGKRGEPLVVLIRRFSPGVSDVSSIGGHLRKEGETFSEFRQRVVAWAKEGSPSGLVALRMSARATAEMAEEGAR